RYFQTEAQTEASSSLGVALDAENATIIPADSDDRTEEQKAQDIRVIYPSREEQQKAALAAYEAVVKEGKGGTAILARLGEAGLLLDKRDWDGAIAAYDAVLGTPLASADVDVKGRALEGKGFALEGKGDLDGALQAFGTIADLPSDYFKVLALYHRGRIELAKKEKDKATETLKEAKSVMEKAKVGAQALTAVHPYRWLESAVDDKLREIDPKLALPTPGGAGGPALSPDQIKQMLKEKGLDSEFPQ
ncbi:MAG: hypothetical protein KC731_04215, partial [Myxococcales bacterium]|nr:hypothetical protein [Myxococcales bacterium]